MQQPVWCLNSSYAIHENKLSFITSTPFSYTHQHLAINPYVPEPDNMADSSYATLKTIKQPYPINVNFANNWVLFIFFFKSLHNVIHIS